MTNAARVETEAVNADSFLDIVASIVSIMIIMVLMTGLKIRHAPVDAADIEEAVGTDPELAREMSDEQTMRGDVLKLAGEIRKVQQETFVSQQERDVLATVVRTFQLQAEQSREHAEGPTPLDPVMAGKLVDARNRLEEVQQLCLAIERSPAASERIESYPTPLSRPVDGRELHLQLLHGRIAYIPLDELLARFKSDAERKVHKLADSPELTETVGPEGGFRLRYTLERHEVSATEARHSGRAGAYVRLKHWTLIPVDEHLGETVEEALSEGSQLQQAITQRRVRGATVTCWTYPDSFDTFRRLKKELYRMDFAVAARPLPEGAPIGGSPEGVRSTAE